MLQKLLGRPLFGSKDDGAILPWWWHSQNLDERPGDGHNASGWKILHGRGWLHMGDAAGRHMTLHVSWNLRSDFCHAYVHVDDDDHDVTLSIALPPVALWVGMEGLPKRLFKVLGVDYDTVKNLPHGVYLTEREVRVSVHDWKLWWNLWMPDGMSSSTDPRWRRGCFDLMDAIFGDFETTTEEIKSQAVLIPMPEKNYRASLKITRNTHRRARWPFRFGRYPLFSQGLMYDVKMEDGEQIPVPGKGENSWDCDEDATYSQAGPLDRASAAEAIAEVVKHALRRRQQYGGSVDWKPEPKPTVHA